jgi:rRNA maturation RNase YbeY
MTDFNYISDFQLVDEKSYSNWIHKIAQTEQKILSDICYIFCDDEYLLNMNQEYLNHDTLTDIITFDYTKGNTISGDIFISVERVTENADNFEVGFEQELRRVMAHGILHLSGYGDKTEKDIVVMRHKEEEMMNLFHVEQI